MELNFDRMVQEILNRTNLSRDDLMARMKQKQDELGGLVTPEGLAMIVGREFGIEFKREGPKPEELRIEDLIPGMSNIDLLARVVRVYEPREFQRRDGSMGKVANLMLQDRTGWIRAVLWNDKASLVEEDKIQKGAAVRVRGAHVREGLNKEPEVNVGSRGSITVDPDDPRVRDLPPLAEAEVKIAELKPELGEVDLFGRVAAVSDVRTLERPDGSSGRVATLLLVDGTGKVRVSLWDDRAKLANSFKRGDVVKLENAAVRAGPRGPELRLGAGGRILLNPQLPEAYRLPEVVERLLKIEELETDMVTVDLAARVRRKFAQQEFRRDDGTPGRVTSVILEDETGIIRASFWNGGSELAQKLRVGDAVLVRNAYTRAGRGGKPELHAGKATRLEINPLGLVVGELKPSRTRIGELEPGMDALEVVGRVMEVIAPRSFTRADGSEGKVATLTVGDQTGVVRVSLWQEHADETEGVKVGDVVALRNAYTTAGLFGQTELQLGKLGRLELNPALGEEFPHADVLSMLSISLEPKTIGELQKAGMRARVRGTLARVFQRRPIFDVCPNCVVEGLIWTNPGFSPVSEIKVGDSLIGIRNTLKVLNTNKHSYSGKVVFIKPRYFEGVTLTEDHPVLVLEVNIRGKRKKRICELKWKRAIELQEGNYYHRDYLLIPKKDEGKEIWIDFRPFMKKYAYMTERARLREKAIELKQKGLGYRRISREIGIPEGTVGDWIRGHTSAFYAPKLPKWMLSPVKLDEDLAELFGWYVAEGCVTEKEVLIALGADEIKNIDRVKELALRMGFSLGISEVKNEKGVLVRIPSRVLSRALSTWFGKGARNKRLPSFLMNARKRVTEAFLNAYIEGDGYKGRRTWQITTASKGLAKQLQILLLKLGTIASYRETRRKEGKILGRKVNSPTIYRLDIWKGMKINKTYLEDDSFYYVPIVNKEVRDFSGIVFDITTDGGIFCLPFVVHNCGRSLGSVDTSLLCEECGKVVSPEHRVVLSFVVDDGTGSIRAVLFGKVAEELLGMDAGRVFELFKQSRDLAEFYEKLGLKGREVILRGTTRHDRYSDQLELGVSGVELPDAKREARELLEKIKATGRY